MGFFDGLAGALFGGATNLINANQNRKYQNKVRKETMEYNTAEREAAQAYQTSERLAVQEYNTPENQMARLMTAGINPNSAAGLVSGQSGASPMSSSGAQMSPISTDQPTPFDAATYFRMAAEVENLEADTAGKKIDNENMQDVYELTKQEKEVAIHQMYASGHYYDELGFKTAKEREWVDKINQATINLTDAEIKSYIKALDLTDQQIEESKARTDESKARTETEQHKQANIDASTELLNAQTTTENYKQEELESQSDVNRQSAEKLSYEAVSEMFNANLRAQGLNPNASNVPQTLVNQAAAAKSVKSAQRVLTSVIQSRNEVRSRSDKRWKRQSVKRALDLNP